MDEVADFRTKCKDLTENEILLLCSEPGKNFCYRTMGFYITAVFLDSRQAFVDKLENPADSEVSKYSENVYYVGLVNQCAFQASNTVKSKPLQSSSVAGKSAAN